LSVFQSSDKAVKSRLLIVRARILDFQRQVKRFGKWIVEVIAIIVAERYLNPVIDLLSGHALSANDTALGGIGIVAIIVASVLGVFLAQGSYKWWKAANQALLETRIQSSSGGARRLPQARIEVKDKTFEHQDVLLDGHTWERCTFNSCNLVVGTGDFSLLYSNFSKCQLVPDGIAAQVLRLAYYLYPGIPLKLAPGEVETNKVIRD
jgi:hypothetical protein